MYVRKYVQKNNVKIGESMENMYVFITVLVPVRTYGVKF